jgi:hypothetical protein
MDCRVRGSRGIVSRSRKGLVSSAGGLTRYYTAKLGDIDLERVGSLRP